MERARKNVRLGIEPETVSSQIRDRFGPLRGVTIDLAPVAEKSEVPVPSTHKPSDLECVYRALVTGTRDYVKKTGFEKVAIALALNTVRGSHRLHPHRRGGA